MPAQVPGQEERPAERLLYDAWLRSLDAESVARDYPGAMKGLRSTDPDRIRTALAMLGFSKAPGAIAHIVPLLDSTEHGVRIEAGLALDRLVSSIQLARRDPARPDAIVLRPRLPGDPDLTPLCWLVRRLCREPNDGSISGYAATMAARLELKGLEPELTALLKSRHPSVRNSALNALQELGLSQNALSAHGDGIALPRRPDPDPRDPAVNAAKNEELNRHVEAAVAEFRAGFIKGFRHGSPWLDEAAESLAMPNMHGRASPWWAGFMAGFEAAKATHGPR
jgi:HEAT repeat protein